MLKITTVRRISIICASLVIIAGVGFAVFASNNPNFLKSGASSDVAANVEDVIETDTYTTTETVLEETTGIETSEDLQEITTSKEDVTSENVTEDSSLDGENITTTAIEETTTNTLDDDAIYSSAARQNASYYSAYINEVYNLINEVRVSNGADAVTLDLTLNVAACHRAYENAINNFFYVDSSTGHHMRPNGQKASTIAAYYGLSGLFGEVMGRYQTSADQIVEGWVESTTHFNVLISSKYTRVGVGVATDSDGNYYWVAIFMS